ncbi:hypothetical protein AB0J28_18470 [Streptosporangium canum]|uniref:hypothetical protein n=1 Tax=Streptosporangium canum TaxID=324952 RepID=UPI0034403D26
MPDDPPRLQTRWFLAMAAARHRLHLDLPVRRGQPAHHHDLSGVWLMSGLYRPCGACNGMCFTGFNPNRRPIPCRACNATGRVYVGGRK